MFESEEKTEKPTFRKLQKEREKGNVPKSAALTFALFLFASLILLGVFTHFFSFKRIFYLIFSHLNDLTIHSALKIAFSFWNVLFLFMTAAFVLIFAANFVQTGWIWIKKREKKKTGKKGSLLLPFLKISIATVITFFVIRIKPLSKWIFSSSIEKEKLLFTKLFWLLILISLSFILLGIGDFLYQRWLFLKKMRMTPREIREEKKEEETNKNIKSKQKLH